MGEADMAHMLRLLDGRERIETGLKKFGAMLGDEVKR